MNIYLVLCAKGYQSMGLGALGNEVTTINAGFFDVFKSKFYAHTHKKDNSEVTWVLNISIP